MPAAHSGFHWVAWVLDILRVKKLANIIRMSWIRDVQIRVVSEILRFCFKSLNCHLVVIATCEIHSSLRISVRYILRSWGRV